MKTRSTYVMALLTAILVPLQAYAFTKALPWSSSASMAGARFYHTATKLTNGKVLVVGGRNSTAAAIKTVEVYDPATNKWTAGTALDVARKNHTATLVTVSSSERVLITGGSDETNASLATALLCTDAGVCTATTAMNVARAKHTATLLDSGDKVLVVGGVDTEGNPLQTTRVYDVSAATWTNGTSLTTARYDHAAAVVESTVYVIGGTGVESDAEIVLDSVETSADIGGTAWTPGTPMGTKRTRHTATVFGASSDKILVAGGFGAASSADNSYLKTAEVFTTSWTATGTTMVVAHAEHSAIKLGTGDVLIIGGTSNGVNSIPNVDIYMAGASTWSPTGTGALGIPRKNAAAVLLTNGKVLITGGANGTAALSTTELYDSNMTAPEVTANDTGTIGLNSVNSVTLNMKASIKSNGAATAASFDYSTDNFAAAANTKNVIAVPSSIAATTTANTPITGTKSGLLCGTNYFYRGKGVNAVGSHTGTASTAKKLNCAPPKITNGTVSSITKTTATLNAKVSGLGSAITGLKREYGIASGSYASTLAVVTSPTSMPAAGTGDTAMTADLTGLECGKKYYYRFVATIGATSNLVTTNGAEANFNTSACVSAADLSVTLSSALTSATGTPITTVATGNAVTYTAKVTNPATTTVAGVSAASATADGAIFKFPSATGVTIGSVSCTATAGDPTEACPDTTPTVADLQGSKGLVIKTLPAGGSVTFTMTGTVAANAAGAIIKMATITAPKLVTDPVAINNTARDIDRVTITRANLTVESITLSPVSPVSNTAFTAKVVVKNAANSIAAGKFYVDFWNDLKTTDQACGVTGDAWASVSSLPAGTSTTVTLTGLTAGTAGAKDARAFVDSWCEVTESTANDADSAATNQAVNQLTKAYTVVPNPILASIAVSPTSIAENSTGNLVYTVTLDKAPTVATTVNLTTAGTATDTGANADYTGKVATVVIAAGSTTNTVTIDPATDTLTTEGDETVVITITSGTGYTVGTPAAATGTITDVPST